MIECMCYICIISCTNLKRGIRKKNRNMNRGEDEEKHTVLLNMCCKTCEICSFYVNKTNY